MRSKSVLIRADKSFVKLIIKMKAEHITRTGKSITTPKLTKKIAKILQNR